jgi:thioesterase III
MFNALMLRTSFSLLNKEGLLVTDFKTFKFELIIKEHHLDTFDHVNNAVYLQLLEEARWEFLNSQGFDLKTIHELKIGPIILECHIKFIKELALRQRIIIESKVISYEKKIGIMQQNIFNDQAMLCCEAQLTFGLFDMIKRKLILPTLPWLKAIGVASDASDSNAQAKSLI